MSQSFARSGGAGALCRRPHRGTHFAGLPLRAGAPLCGARRSAATHGVGVDSDAPSCSGRSAESELHARHARPADAALALGGRVATVVAMTTGLSLLSTGGAWASGGAFSGGALDLFTHFLDKVEAMGPAGGVVFVLVVMVSEMIPLFPTQPLSLASGLLFGGKQGAVLMLLGVTLAATNAFIISRGVGRPLAEKIIKWEMSEEEGNSAHAQEHNMVAKKLAEVQRTIETGSFWQQLISVALLRLTPVVPFSASNYVLGLTPLQLPAFVCGTLAGMSVWAVLYASLGGAGRSLLESGVDLGDVFAEMAEQSGAYTRPVLLAACGLAALAGAAYLITNGFGSSAAASSGGSNGEGSSSKGVAGGASASEASVEVEVERVKQEQLLRK